MAKSLWSVWSGIAEILVGGVYSQAAVTLNRLGLSTSAISNTLMRGGDETMSS